MLLDAVWCVLLCAMAALVRGIVSACLILGRPASNSTSVSHLVPAGAVSTHRSCSSTPPLPVRIAWLQVYYLLAVPFPYIA